MTTRKRRFKKGRIDFLSLVVRGANNLSTVYKGEGTRVVMKASEDKGEITALVYVPEVRDKQGEIASAPVIKDMAYGYARSGLALDLMHDEQPIDPSRAFVAENFLVQKGDPRFSGWKDNDGQPIDATGGWGVVIKVDDPALRALYRDGKWAGISMGGDGDFIDETKVGKAQEHDMNEEQITALVQKSIAAALKAGKAQEHDMNEEQITALVQKSIAAALKAAGIVEKPEDKTSKLPVFKGDITKATAKELREHAARVKKARLFADVDLNDPEAVEAVAKALEDEEKAAAKAKQSNQAPDAGKVNKTALPSAEDDEDETDEVEKGADEGFIVVDVPDHIPETEAQSWAAQQFMLGSMPDERRVSKSVKPVAGK